MCYRGVESCTVMNLYCVIPKANFNEEKQTLFVAYCALLGRPLPDLFPACSVWVIANSLWQLWLKLNSVFLGIIIPFLIHSQFPWGFTWSVIISFNSICILYSSTKTNVYKGKTQPYCNNRLVKVFVKALFLFGLSCQSNFIRMLHLESRHLPCRMSLNLLHCEDIASLVLSSSNLACFLPDLDLSSPKTFLKLLRFLSLNHSFTEFDLCFESLCCWAI